MHATGVPAALADRLGPEATLGLVQALDVAQRECVDMTLTQSIDRFERRLSEETSNVRVEIGALRLEMHDGFARADQKTDSVRLEIAGLRQDMAAQRFDTLKWSFLFWIGQVAAFAGIASAMWR